MKDVVSDEGCKFPGKEIEFISNNNICVMQATVHVRGRRSDKQISIDFIKFSENCVPQLAHRNHSGLVYVSCTDPKLLYV